MKLKNIFSLILMGLVLGFTGCEPIEDRDTLSNSFDPEAIELDVVQATDGGNKLSIQMNTPGVTGYWDYLLDTKYSDRVEVVFPYTGNLTFTYYVTTPYMTNGTPETTEYIQKTVTVEVNKLDERLPDAYYFLVGDDLGGKTWVFDKSDDLWWYMSDPTNPFGLWWNAGVDAPPIDADGKMHFDVNGGLNYTYWSDAAGSPVEGSKFVFNPDFTKIIINGDANILGSVEGGGNNGTFDIVELTADRMVLHVPNAAWSTGWTWELKPMD